jgi:hypothetical protein
MRGHPLPSTLALFRAEVYRDDVSAAARFALRAERVGAVDVLRASLAPAGGLLIRLTPAQDSPEAKGAEQGARITLASRRGAAVDDEHLTRDERGLR